MGKMSSKKSTTDKTKKSRSKSSTKKDTTKTKKAKTSKEKPKEEETKEEKGKRRSLISALKRSISVKGGTPIGAIKDPMNIVITLSPAKHVDIIEYIEGNIPAGGRAEWVRDSIRLKMRIEKGVYGLSTTGQDGTQKDSEEALQSVFGQFAEVMTKVMSDLKTSQPAPRQVEASPRPERSRPTPRERPERGGPPQLRKLEVDESAIEEAKPDRPSLDDAIGAIVVVE